MCVCVCVYVYVCVYVCVCVCMCVYVRTTDINECLSSPCENNGTCYDEVNGFICSCSAGFNGTFCETGQDSKKLDVTLLLISSLRYLEHTIINA